MKAAVYFGPEDIKETDVADARLENPHDVLVEVSATSICGSDLHLYRGALDGIMERGRSQTGHELIGTVREVGSGVGKFKVGDRISMGYSCSCGDCYMCHVGQTAHCETTNKAVYGFGVGFGDLNGTHSEALVLPYADGHAIKVPDSISDSAALTLSCNLPTAIIANQLAEIQPGEKVALVGCGPTGLLCLDLINQRDAGNGGSIIMISSLAGRRGLADYGAYCASKFALTGMTQQLALELARFGIRTNCIAPGSHSTDMMDGTIARSVDNYGLSEEQFRAALANASPMGRQGFPYELAAAVAFMAGDDASYVNGQTLNVDGGAQMN